MGLAGHSSSQLKDDDANGGEGKIFVVNAPKNVPVQHIYEQETTGVMAAHDGYIDSHGLTHMRRIELSNDGRQVLGEDTLAAVSQNDQEKFDGVMDHAKLQGIPFTVRFHLHPEVKAEIDMGGSAISLSLPSGEVWVFRFEGRANMTLESSAYLEKTRLKPRKSKQVVLSGVAMDYATCIRWTLAKAQETPSVLRDFGQGNMAVLPN